ncbi:alpha/beta hydrolase [Blastococcus sp. Marseille-P5729]|uniref:alpha/beta hydrolase family protein n=1 Tax=Blastococcus sp. Marseille-P5729 TaxID=2086582 RepID=UPI000D108284|nr:alpha/beta hydrolase [Blastococcus sp. Marseille-P5729]
MDHEAAENSSDGQRLGASGRRPRRARRGPWVGAAIAMAIAAAALWCWSMTDQWMESAPGASLRITAVNLAIPVTIGVIVWAACRFLVRRRWPRVPSLYIAVLAASLVLLLTLPAGVSRTAWLVAVVVIVCVASLVGGATWALVCGTRSRGRTVTALVVASLVAIAVVVWLTVPTGTPPAPLDAGSSDIPPVPDLSTPGQADVQTLTYGSGDDKLREEYRDVAFTTPTVDLSDVVTRWSDGAGADRTALWGFDATALPLNARVWYPSGEGPFPVVLMVHGNTGSVEFSEGGLAYLGEQLASRGTIAISIDEGFLATTLLDSGGGIGGAEVARAVLALEHLVMLRDQPTDLGPLSGKVDLSRVALLGHSRGGEAVAVASAINDLGALPDHPSHAVDYGFAIEAVVALAPSDGQYQPDGEKVYLSDVSYLVIQGSHDADVASFGGSSQYARTTPGGGQLKALLYVGGANHTQFNTLWGRRDIGYGLPKMFIDTGALIEPEEQRTVALGYVTAFVETTLLDNDQSALLEDYRAGSQWLPETRYISQYAAGGSIELLTGQEDDVEETATLDGASVVTSGGGSWDEGPVELRWGAGDNRVVSVTCKGSDTVEVAVELPAPLTLPAAGTVSVDAAVDSGEELVPVQLVVTDAAGNEATADLPGGAPPPIAGDTLKAGWMQPGALVEPVLQTSTAPLASLAGIDLAQVTRIAVRAACSGQTVLIDNLTVDPSAS